jgi:hypothetical protein
MPFPRIRAPLKCFFSLTDRSQKERDPGANQNFIGGGRSSVPRAEKIHRTRIGEEKAVQIARYLKF